MMVTRSSLFQRLDQVRHQPNIFQAVENEIKDRKVYVHNGTLLLFSLFSFFVSVLNRRTEFVESVCCHQLGSGCVSIYLSFYPSIYMWLHTCVYMYGTCVLMYICATVHMTCVLYVV